jgi:hypothetical protein
VCDTNNHALRLLNLATRGVKTLEITGVPRLTPPAAAVPEPSTTTDSTRPVPAYLGLPRQPTEATLHVADTPNGQFALQLAAPPRHHISAGTTAHRTHRTHRTFSHAHAQNRGMEGTSGPGVVDQVGPGEGPLARSGGR